MLDKRNLKIWLCALRCANDCYGESFGAVQKKTYHCLLLNVFQIRETCLVFSIFDDFCTSIQYLLGPRFPALLAYWILGGHCHVWMLRHTTTIPRRGLTQLSCTRDIAGVGRHSRIFIYHRFWHDKKTCNRV